MRSEIARQHRPKAVPIRAIHLHSRLPRAPQHAGPTIESVRRGEGRVRPGLRTLRRFRVL
eukprot:2738053-Prymnesium_polylepis.1